IREFINQAECNFLPRKKVQVRMWNSIKSFRAADSGNAISVPVCAMMASADQDGSSLCLNPLPLHRLS
ncbi:MAG: hypothetical protein FWF29_13550, partial [Treponema sp.]|nr:hypothetical protein [Treponema sp.]